MPTDRSTLPSVQYWQQSDTRRRQRFYVLICLALTSIRDRFLALRLQSEGNNNWSATMSYYSMFHAARFVSLQILGDIPYDHQPLINLISGKAVELKWLGRFDPNQSPQSDRPESRLDIILQYFIAPLAIETADVDVSRLAKFLDLARVLRNRSNYDSPLIANEHNHVTVSESAELLASAMARAAEQVGDFLRRDLIAETELGPDIADPRSDFMGFAHDHLSIFGRQFARMNPDPNELLEYLGRFRFQGSLSRSPAFDESVMHPDYGGLFGPKAILIQEYRRRVREFSEFVRTVAE